MKQFDVVVVGSGPGGYVAAIRAAQLGAKVAIVEKEQVGGVCLNWGCIPTKAMLKSAKVYKTFMHAEDYGITVDKSTVKFDLAKIVGRKDGVVKRLTGGVKMLLEKNGVEIIQGYAEVLDKSTIQVGNEQLKTKNIILATGASPIMPPIPGVKEALEKGIIVTSKEILSLQEVPKKLTIIGGGVIGIEFATIFSTLGTEVTIVERMDQILVNVDGEVRASYLQLLKRSNLNIITSANVVEVKDHVVTYEKDGKKVQVNADKILMSVGMKPNTESFTKLGVETTRAGVTVDETMKTSIPGVYAIGDVNGRIMLAHVASAEAMVAANNIMGHKDSMNYKRVPACIYGFPEIAMVGITEEQAKEQKLEYKVSKFPIGANGKALAEGEPDGFIKLITDVKYGEILGVHILASNATDLISEGVTAMELEGTAFEVAKSIHPHPTSSEILMEAAHGIVDKPIHIYVK